MIGRVRICYEFDDECEDEDEAGQKPQQHEVTLAVHVRKAGTPSRSAKVIGTVWARRV